MKKKWGIALIAGAVLIISSYWLYDYFAGNHIEVKDVIPSEPASSTTAKAASDANETDQLWTIDTQQSNVYFSVKTSKEAVSFAVNNVQGSWDFSAAKPETMRANAKLDMNAIDSGNSMRDDDVKGYSFFNVDQFPEATFTMTSVESWPTQWKDGQKTAFKMKGQLTVKGIPKNVVFDSEAVFEGGMLKLQGETKVTFNDFGMSNPHTLVLDTENEVHISLRIVLTSASAPIISEEVSSTPNVQ